MCVTADHNQNISYGISPALQNIALLFWQPSLRKKTKKTNKHKNKTQTTSHQKVSHFFFLLFAHLVVTHSPNGHMPPPPPHHPTRPCSTTEALHCTRSPRMQSQSLHEGLGISREPLKGSLALQTSTRKKAKEGEERECLYGSTSTSINKQQ